MSNKWLKISSEELSQLIRKNIKLNHEWLKAEELDLEKSKILARNERYLHSLSDKKYFFSPKHYLLSGTMLTKLLE